MGSAVCRAKKVAPALATDNSRNLEGSRFFNAPKAPAEDLRRSRHVCPGQGQESDVACDEEELEKDVEKILDACGRADGVLNKRLFQKDFFSSRTCGLCYSKRGQHESDSISANGRLTQSEGVRRDDNCPFLPIWKTFTCKFSKSKTSSLYSTRASPGMQSNSNEASDRRSSESRSIVHKGSFRSWVLRAASVCLACLL